GREERVASGAPLRPGQWYFVAASLDASSDRASVVQRPHPEWPRDETRATAEGSVSIRAVEGSQAPFIMAGLYAGEERGQTLVEAHYNGKLEAPALFAAALSGEQLDRLWNGVSPGQLGAPLVAAWDFARDTPTDSIREVAGH